MVGTSRSRFVSVRLAAGFALSLLAAYAGSGAGVGAARAEMAQGLAAAKAGDFERAYAEWLPLAEEGNTAAQYNIAQLYRRGKGVKRDYAKAAEWFGKAAQFFHTPSRYNLAVMYEKGIGVPVDYTRAHDLYLLAANQGFRLAQFNLAVMYSIGQGVPRSYPRAYMWYSLATAQGDEGAEKNLELLIEQMAPEQITLAQVMLARWKKRWAKAE